MTFEAEILTISNNIQLQPKLDALKYIKRAHVACTSTSVVVGRNELMAPRVAFWENVRTAASVSRARKEEPCAQSCVSRQQNLLSPRENVT